MDFNFKATPNCLTCQEQTERGEQAKLPQQLAGWRLSLSVVLKPQHHLHHHRQLGTVFTQALTFLPQLLSVISSLILVLRCYSPVNRLCFSCRLLLDVDSRPFSPSALLNTCSWLCLLRQPRTASNLCLCSDSPGLLFVRVFLLVILQSGVICKNPVTVS